MFTFRDTTQNATKLIKLIISAILFKVKNRIINYFLHD